MGAHSRLAFLRRGCRFCTKIFAKIPLTKTLINPLFRPGVFHNVLKTLWKTGSMWKNPRQNTGFFTFSTGFSTGGKPKAGFTRGINRFTKAGRSGKARRRGPLGHGLCCPAPGRRAPHICAPRGRRVPRCPAPGRRGLFRPAARPSPLIRGGAGPYSANGASAEKMPGACAHPQPRPAAHQPPPGHGPALHQPRPGPPASGGSCKNLPQTGASDGNLSHKVVYWTG